VGDEAAATTFEGMEGAVTSVAASVVTPAGVEAAETLAGLARSNALTV